MQTYQSTPDFYRDYIEHGYLKDAAAKAHKYLKRWKNAAGKWVYQYKKPESHISLESAIDNRYLTNYDKKRWSGAHSNTARDIKNKRWKDVENAKNRVSQRRAMGNAVSTLRPMGSSNRKDTPYKKRKGYSGNLTQRGYSGSQGSGENKRLRNLGARKSSKDRWYYEGRRINKISEDQDKNGGFYRGHTVGTTKNKAPKKFQQRMAKKGAVKARNYKKNMNKGGIEWSNQPQNWNRRSRKQYWWQ